MTFATSNPFVQYHWAACITPEGKALPQGDHW
jgi:hypothetical protein